MDVVYPLGTGSRWNNHELHYSLRCLEENLKGVRNVYVVGENPNLKNVIHIPYPDVLVNNADGNITNKIVRVCKEKSLSDDFLFINDDHLIFKPIEISKFPNFFKFDLETKPDKYFRGNLWRRRLHRTFKELQKRGLPTLHFDCHTPIIFNKKKCLQVFSHFDYKQGIGYTMKSIYANAAKVKPTQLNGEKVLVTKPHTQSELNELTENTTIVSLKDEAITPDLKYFLAKKYPKKSKFEKVSIPKEFDKELILWLENPKRKYDAGVVLFEKEIGNKPLINYFRGNSDRNKQFKKLSYYLNQLAGRDLDTQYSIAL